MHVAQQHAGAGHGVARVDLQPRELLEREHPAAERHAAARDARCPRRRSVTGIPAAEASRRIAGDSCVVRGHEDPLGMAALAARKHLPDTRTADVRPTAHTSRITGMISGRLDVCFTMYRFRSARIFSFMTPQSVFSSWFEPSSVLATICRARIQERDAVLGHLRSRG